MICRAWLVVSDGKLAVGSTANQDSPLMGAEFADITGTPMRGLVTVAPEGFRTAAALRGWVEEAVAHASSLPPKRKRARRRPRKERSS